MNVSDGARQERAAPPEVERRWVLRGGELHDADVAALGAALSLPPALCRLLLLRGCADADAARTLLKPRLEQLHDPLLLTGVAAAVDRITLAIGRGERILVHGDYDVDGISAAALFTRVLRRSGADVEPFVPHRMTDGYDLGYAGVRRAVEAGAGVILTGDCGIVAHDAVAAAAAAGIDVIITDHHTPGPTLPAACAVINPSQPGCAYPEKHLAGAGVAFKLCEALVAQLGGDRDALMWDLDLVALATIADLAPLRGENRVLASYGLRVLRQSRNAGLRALLRVAGVSTDEPISAGQVSHVLAPRLNAVGRLGAAMRGVNLLLTESEAEADALAAEMEDENRSRQALDRQMLAEAMTALAGTYDPARDYAIVLSAPDWHAGVIGIVASRIVERLHRPVLLIAEDRSRGSGRGSGRSIPGFDLYAGIHACAPLLDRYGGHRQAAGLDVRLERIPALRAALNEHAHAMLTPDQLVPELRIDLEIDLGEANAELHRLLRHLGPFGLGHPQPVFMARNIDVAGYPREVGGGQHLKLVLASGGVRLPAVGFRMAERLRTLDFGRTRIDVAFQLQEDRWNGRGELQARLVDVRPTA